MRKRPATRVVGRLVGNKKGPHRTVEASLGRVSPNTEKVARCCRGSHDDVCPGQRPGTLVDVPLRRHPGGVTTLKRVSEPGGSLLLPEWMAAVAVDVTG